ncbi:shikimate kinase [Marivirga sericea]|uniref:Shikimate kinase n=1 Tax=Marivirga sericea TaxID=1028 RepID=A0A1X7JY76_9BACT|nr:shikimate kinase [Marivirga sericea]SMG33094.1 shikimate kinase [Marivirga sericea]
MRYFLLGLPGSGKSHWGNIWSSTLKSNYFDLDEVIENNEGESISDLFKSEGEEYFRNLETFYLNKLINNYKSLILSTGGGTPCFNGNMDLMNKQGLTIFLNPPVEENAKRVWKPENTNRRPMFSDCNSLEDVQKLLSKLRNNRITYYQQAAVELKDWNKNTVSDLK